VKKSDVDATLYQIELPLRSPFVTAVGEVTSRVVGLVAIDRDGVTGWGEAAPYPGQDEPFEAVMMAARNGGMTPCLAAAVDEAVCDSVARSRGERLVDELGASKKRIPVSVAVGMDDGAVGRVDRAVEAGIGRVKVKIAPGRIDHVRAIRDRFPDLTMGVDANGSFNTSTWAELLALKDLDVAYLEQPFVNLTRVEVSTLRDAGFAVFADESVRSVSDGVALLSRPHVAGVVIKPGRLGWQASMALAQLARDAGKRWRVSGLLESGIGRIYTDLLAAAEDAYLPDVAPADWFFTSDVVASRHHRGEVTIPDGPGTGITVDRAEVESRARATVQISGSVVPDPC
jgi:O-succinylbenzoate synthase